MRESPRRSWRDNLNRKNKCYQVSNLHCRQRNSLFRKPPGCANPIRSDSFGFRNKNIHFGLGRIDKIVSLSDRTSIFEIKLENTCMQKPSPC